MASAKGKKKILYLFTPGNNVQIGVTINDGHNGTGILTTMISNSVVKLLTPGNNSSDTTLSSRAVRGNSYATPENMIFIYDNTDGNTTNRPVWGTWAEKDGITTNFTSWYSGNVDTVANGAWGAYIPRIFPNGIQRIEQRSVATGDVIDCPAISVDGIWANAGNTVNPTGGINPQIVFSITEAGLAPAYTITSSAGANGTISPNGATVVTCGTQTISSLASMMRRARLTTCVPASVSATRRG